MGELNACEVFDLLLVARAFTFIAHRGVAHANRRARWWQSRFAL